LWVSLQASLQDFQIDIKYLVYEGQGRLLTLYYGETLTDGQIQTAVAKVARAVMEQIKANQQPQP
jgi:hypothetical protein